MLKTTNAEFSFTEVWFTDKNNRSLEIEDNVNITLIIGTYRKYVQGYGFCHWKFGGKYGKKLTDTATKTGIDAAKTASKRVVQKTAEATGDLIENKAADKITSVGKSQNKEQKEKMKQTKQTTYIPLEERQSLMI